MRARTASKSKFPRARAKSTSRPRARRPRREARRGDASTSRAAMRCGDDDFGELRARRRAARQRLDSSRRRVFYERECVCDCATARGVRTASRAGERERGGTLRLEISAAATKARSKATEFTQQRVVGVGFPVGFPVGVPVGFPVGFPVGVAPRGRNRRAGGPRAFRKIRTFRPRLFGSRRFDAERIRVGSRRTRVEGWTFRRSVRKRRDGVGSARRSSRVDVIVRVVPRLPCYRIDATRDPRANVRRHRRHRRRVLFQTFNDLVGSGPVKETRRVSDPIVVRGPTRIRIGFRFRFRRRLRLRRRRRRFRGVQFGDSDGLHDARRR